MGTNKVIFGYNGRDGVVTDNNGLIYMRARYYSTEMKRFINADIYAAFKETWEGDAWKFDDMQATYIWRSK